MKTAIKKVLSMTLVLVLLLSVFPTTAFAAPHGPQFNNPWHHPHDFRDPVVVEPTGSESSVMPMLPLENEGPVVEVETVTPVVPETPATEEEVPETPATEEEAPETPATEEEAPAAPILTEAPAAPTTCAICGAALADDACTGCWVIATDCQCKKTPTAPENHRGEIKFTPKFNDGFGKFYNGTPVYVGKNATMGDVFAKIAVPADYSFSYWSWDLKGEQRINNHDHIPSNTPWNTEFVIYAQYAKNIQATKGAEIHLSLNYDHKMGETLRNVAVGTRMSDVLNNIQDPVRWGYKFKGWYWDPACKSAVNGNERVTKSCTIFAKWEKGGSYETMLKIYINGDTKSAAKIVDMHDYAKDGWISLDEVKTVVKKYFTAKDSRSLDFYGVYDAANWNIYVRNHRHAGTKGIAVEHFNDTTAYVMVYNAKAISSSSSTADKTNPKTGDMIMTPVIVLGASATCLAVLFYLNKKRSY